MVIIILHSVTIRSLPGRDSALLVRPHIRAGSDGHVDGVASAAAAGAALTSPSTGAVLLAGRFR